MTATFTGPGGADPVAAIKTLVAAASATEGDLLYALQRQRSRILKRTAAGVDADGAPFAPYSPAYAKKKAAYGRAGVDLRGRNAPNMLQAIVTTAGGLSGESGESDTPAGTGTIGFYDERAAMLAEVHNEGATIRSRLSYGGFEEASWGYTPRNSRRYKQSKATFEMPRRHFFAASDEEIAEMERDIGERIEVRLKGRAA